MVGVLWFGCPAGRPGDRESSAELADFTTEVCDGLPSYVEDGTLSGDYFCPWSAEVIAIDE